MTRGCGRHSASSKAAVAAARMPRQRSAKLCGSSRAIPLLREALHRNPNSSRGAYALGLSLAMQQDLQAALEAAETAVRLRPGQPEFEKLVRALNHSLSQQRANAS